MVQKQPRRLLQEILQEILQEVLQDCTVSSEVGLAGLAGNLSTTGLNLKLERLSRDAQILDHPLRSQWQRALLGSPQIGSEGWWKPTNAKECQVVQENGPPRLDLAVFERGCAPCRGLDLFRTHVLVGSTWTPDSS